LAKTFQYTHPNQTNSPKMKPMDYFTIFSLPPHLTLDTAALEKSFYALSRKLHPDRFAARPAAEQEAALAESSRLNDAYRTLRDPIARTEYLLKLEGIELEEQSSAATAAARTTGTAKKQVVPEDLLEEAFELNMQLEEMRAAKKIGDDDPQLRTDLQRAKSDFDAKLAATDADLAQLHAQWDTAVDANSPSAKLTARDAMVALLNRRSYLRNLVRDVNDALEA
jgi:molecular chaperone HscB